MENKAKTRTERVLLFLHILTWVIFIGLCVKTGSIIISFFVSHFVNAAGASDLHNGLNLSSLYEYSLWQYSALVSLMIFLSALKAYIFYLVIKIFFKLNLVRPFSDEVAALISNISQCAIGVGVISMIASSYCRWISKRGVTFSDLGDYLGGAGEFLLMGGIIFIIAQIFKRGIEIQSENELTV